MTKLERLLACDGLFIGGHRGFSSDYPENTLLAVQEACKLGVDLIEVDVYLSKDNVPVIAHDEHLERCSTGKGLVGDYTLKELKQLDFGIHRGAAFEGLRLPTLEQFLDMMRGYPEVLLNIDFKVYSRTLDTVERVMPIMKETGMDDRAIYNCIDCEIVRHIAIKYGKKTVSAPHDFPWRVNYVPGPNGSFQYMWGICIPIDMLDKAHVDLYRENGIAIVCTPADTPEQVDLAMSLNVTLPMPDDPREYLKRRGA